MSLRAVGYCRANDIPCAQQELHQQQERIRAYCFQHHLTLEHIYVDAGVSGLHLHRKGLQSLLSNAANGQFDVVVVCDTKRLSRRLVDLYKVQNILRKHNVALALCCDDRQIAFLSEEGRLQEYWKDQPNGK